MVEAQKLRNLYSLPTIETTVLVAEFIDILAHFQVP